jgi:hypothetical protein
MSEFSISKYIYIYIYHYCFSQLSDYHDDELTLDLESFTFLLRFLSSV